MVELTTAVVAAAILMGSAFALDPVSEPFAFSDFVRLSPQIYIAWFAFLGFSIAMLRIKPVAKIFESIVYVFPLGRIGTEKPPGMYEPLSVMSWVARLITYGISMELAGAFLALKQRSTEASAAKILNGFFFVYASACIQSLCVLLAHASIKTNSRLEHGLRVWESRFINLNIFGTGLSVGVGPWTLLPVLVGVSFDKLTFGDWLGRSLATYTLYVYFFSKALPPMFPFSFVLFLVVTALVPVGKTKVSDSKHAISAMFLNAALVAMTFTLNRYLHLNS